MSEPRPGGIVALIAFLNARLAEDEATAKGPPGWKLEHWTAVRYADKESGRNWRVDAEPRCVVDAVAREDAQFIARHDPARVLREVAAKRQLIIIALENAADADNERGDGHTADEIAGGKCSSDYGLWAALRNLAPLAAIWEEP